MNLPTNINPCPILDALFEVRFSSKINPNAVFGLIYNVLQNEFVDVETLPILQLPDIVRASDPNFRYKPHYRISNNKFVVQIGPDVISISSFPNYVGWKLFSEKIFDILVKIENTSIINSVERIGIRYVNFFETDIFDKVNLKVCLNNENIQCRNTVIRTEFIQDKFTSTLQIANNANNNGRIGSIIDIDTSSETNIESFFDNKIKFINNAHINEKELFFSLLKTDFLETLNPKY